MIEKAPTWVRIGLIFILVFLGVTAFDFCILCEIGKHFSDPCGLFLILAAFPILPFVSDLPGGYPWYLIAVLLGSTLYFLAGAVIAKLFLK